MNHSTDGNLAAINSHLAEQDDEDSSGTQEDHAALAEWLSLTDAERDSISEKAKWYWDSYGVVPDKEYWEGFRVEDEEPPIGEDTRPKDRVKQGISPSTIIEEIDCRDGNKPRRDDNGGV
jgi:hypothetical protein